MEPILSRVAGAAFHNTSSSTSRSSRATRTKSPPTSPTTSRASPPGAGRSSSSSSFEEQIAKLDEANRLFLVVSKFADIDLHPDAVSNIEMGYIFEELIRRFNEAANEKAGDHFTPREVIRLMVNLLFSAGQ